MQMNVCHLCDELCKCLNNLVWQLRHLNHSVRVSVCVCVRVLVCSGGCIEAETFKIPR